MAISNRAAGRAASATARCGKCRFWLAEPDEDSDCPEDGPGWGWCRRKPPVIVERMADMIIPSLGNRDDNYDPEDVATGSRVADCSLFPATWRDKWCGEFSPSAEASRRPKVRS